MAFIQNRIITSQKMCISLTENFEIFELFWKNFKVCLGCKCVSGASVCRVHVCVGCMCVSGASVLGCMCVSGASVCRIQVCLDACLCWILVCVGCKCVSIWEFHLPHGGSSQNTSPKKVQTAPGLVKSQNWLPFDQLPISERSQIRPKISFIIPWRYFKF